MDQNNDFTPEIFVPGWWWGIVAVLGLILFGLLFLFAIPPVRWALENWDRYWK